MNGTRMNKREDAITDGIEKTVFFSQSLRSSLWRGKRESLWAFKLSLLQFVLGYREREAEQVQWD